MQLNAIDWANHFALRFVVVPHALRAGRWVDHIDFIAHRNSIVRTLWLANVAIDAFFSDSQCHDWVGIPLGRRLPVRPCLLASLFRFGLKPTLHRWKYEFTDISTEDGYFPHNRAGNKLVLLGRCHEQCFDVR
jgi:hypothetical protein